MGCRPAGSNVKSVSEANFLQYCNDRYDNVKIGVEGCGIFGGVVDIYFSNRTRRVTSSGQRSFLPIGVVTGEALERMELEASSRGVEPQEFGDGGIFIDSVTALALLRAAWGQVDINWEVLLQSGVSEETVKELKRRLAIFIESRK